MLLVYTVHFCNPGKPAHNMYAPLKIAYHVNAAIDAPNNLSPVGGAPCIAHDKIAATGKDANISTINVNFANMICITLYICTKN